MGINSHIIIMVGVPLSDTDAAVEKYKKLGLDVVYDGYGGEYAYVGRTLHTSEDGRWDPITTHEQYTIGHLQDERDSVSSKLPPELSAIPPKLIVLMHYS